MPSPASQQQIERLHEVLQDLPSAAPDQALQALGRLLAWLRPARPDQVSVALQRLIELTHLLEASQDLRQGLRNLLLELLASKQPLRLLSDTGIYRHEGFFSGLQRRLTQRLLPEIIDHESLRGVLRELFHRPGDYLWVCGLPDSAWVSLLDVLEIPSSSSQASEHHAPLFEALQVVSYRIAAMSLEAEFVRIYPDIERYESPFLRQNAELLTLLESRQPSASGDQMPPVDDKQLLVLLDQCQQVLIKVRKLAGQVGTSIGLTQLLLRLKQSIRRLHLLLELLEDRPAHELNTDRVRLFQALVRAENRRLSLSEFCSRNLELLARRITGNAGKAGEAYITHGRRQYFGLFRAAIGAGLLVAIMAFTKLAVAPEQALPGKALLYSGIYVSGFVLMSIFHFALATKQPAMTASTLASSLQADRAPQRLANLGELMIRTFRSQFIALAGNFAMAIPLPLLLLLAHAALGYGAYLDQDKAEALIAQVDPLAWKTWLWGAITGLWLFLCGLISGYYDNRAVYDRIPQRIGQLRRLRRVLGPERTARFITWLENHFGAIVGSVAFGLLLACTGIVGKLIGLPIDTLHVTFSTANTVFALFTVPEQISAGFLVQIIAGIFLIGALNLGVSFGLALWVALRSQQARIGGAGELMAYLLRRLLARPQDFLWPPQDETSSESGLAEPADHPGPNAN